MRSCHIREWGLVERILTDCSITYGQGARGIAFRCGLVARVERAESKVDLCELNLQFAGNCAAFTGFRVEM